MLNDVMKMKKAERMSQAVNEWLGADRHSLEKIAQAGELVGVSFESACVVAERWGVFVTALERACVAEARRQMP